MGFRQLVQRGRTRGRAPQRVIEATGKRLWSAADRSRTSPAGNFIPRPYRRDHPGGAASSSSTPRISSPASDSARARLSRGGPSSGGGSGHISHLPSPREIRYRRLGSMISWVAKAVGFVTGKYAKRSAFPLSKRVVASQS